MAKTSGRRNCLRAMPGETLVFHVLWLIAQIAVFIGGYVKQRDDAGLARLNVPLGLTVYISRGSGLVLTMDCILILLPVCRTLISMIRTSWMNRVVPFDKAHWFHKQVAISMLLFTIVHAVGHLFNLLKLDKINFVKPYFILFQHPAGLTGIGMVWIMFLMYTAAWPALRHRRFELFYYTHQLALPFMVLLCLHGTGCFVKTGDGECKGYFTWRYAMLGIAIYVLERCLRMWRSRQHTFISKVVSHPSRVVEIQFRKQGLQYRSGQYVFIQMPDVSRFEWHPFTLTSAPEEDYASVHVRVAGDWTLAVAQRLGCLDNNGAPVAEFRKVALPRISIDGPFGTPSEDVFQYNAAVVIGAGIGVTPFASVLKSVWFQLARTQSVTPMRLKKLHFIWVCRDKDAFEWFGNLLSAMEQDTPSRFLSIHIYLTGKVRMDELEHIIVNNDAASDPTTSLMQRTQYGRPNFRLILDHIRESIVKRPGAEPWQYNENSRVKEVGVFFCGPKVLDRQLRDICCKTSQENVRFCYHKENF